MRFMVLFIGSLLLLGIVLTGTVNCKSDNANPAAPGQQAIKPGNAEGHSGAPGRQGLPWTGKKQPGRGRKFQQQHNKQY